MIICTACEGKGRIKNPGQLSAECLLCDGAGVLIDPQLERMIEAVTQVVKVLADIRYIMDQRARI